MIDHRAYAIRQLQVALEKAEDAPVAAQGHEDMAALALRLQRVPTAAELMALQHPAPGSVRKDEIAKQHAQRWWLSMDSSPDPETPESLIEAFKAALTSYEEERTPLTHQRREMIAKRHTDTVMVTVEEYASYVADQIRGEMWAAMRAAIDEALAEERTPSGEGWQQRIAAVLPWTMAADGTWVCFFCRCWQYSGHAEDCLWANAKDATLPASSGEGASKP